MKYKSINAGVLQENPYSAGTYERYVHGVAARRKEQIVFNTMVQKGCFFISSPLSFPPALELAA